MCREVKVKLKYVWRAGRESGEDHTGNKTSPDKQLHSENKLKTQNLQLTRCASNVCSSSADTKTPRRVFWVGGGVSCSL